MYVYEYRCMYERIYIYVMYKCMWVYWARIYGLAKLNDCTDQFIPARKYLLSFSSLPCSNLCWDPFEESNIILAQAIKLIVKTTPSSRPATTNLFGYPHGAQLISPMGFRGTDFRSMCIYCAYTIFTLECKRSSSSPSCWRVCIFPSRHLLVLRRNRWVGLCGPFNMYEYRIIELWTIARANGFACVYITRYNFIRCELFKLYQLLCAMGMMQ